jgi:hypothetical protein
MQSTRRGHSAEPDRRVRARQEIQSARARRVSNHALAHEAHARDHVEIPPSFDAYTALSAAGGEGHAAVAAVDDCSNELVEAYSGADLRVVELVDALGSVRNTPKLYLEHVLNARVPD